MLEALSQKAVSKKLLTLKRTAYNPRPLQATHVTVTASNDKIYAYGGLNTDLVSTTDFHCLNPATNAWTTLANPSSVRRSAGMGYYNGLIYLYGGFNHATGGVLNTMFSYDIAANTWRTTGLSSGISRHDFSSVVVGNRLYCFGGWNGGPVNTNAYYTMGADTWTVIAAQAGIRYAGCATDGVNIYLVGGQLDSGMMNTVFRYNIASNTFSTLAVLPSASQSCCIAVVDNYLVCYSGYNNGGYNSVIYTMDLAKGTWDTVADPGPVQGLPGACQLGRSVYVVGGYTGVARTGSTNRVEVLE